MGGGGMTRETRAVATRVLVCDLCNEQIPEGEPGETGSITAGWIAHPVTPTTKRVWLLWPPGGRRRRMDWQESRKPENRHRQYDFHADCILRLIEANLWKPQP